MEPWAIIAWVSIVGAFLVGFLLRDVWVVWYLFIIWMIANLLLMIWSQTPFGFYGNPNYLGTAFALAIAGALVYRMWPAIPLFLFGLWMTASRGALVATGITLVAAFWHRLGWKLIVGVTLIGLLFFATMAPRGSDSLMARLGIWQDTLLHLSFFGSGMGSFYEAYYAFPIHTNMIPPLIRPAHAYNDILELLFEFGIGSLPLWLMLILALETQGSERLIALCFGLLTLTFFPLFVPPVGQLFALTIGQLVRKSYGALETYPTALPQHNPADEVPLRGN